MCGISGILSNYKENISESLISKMSAAMNNRGPDSGGIWVDESETIAFGHRRLAILDLSMTGHQPMHSSSGRYVISFNGEIYNHLDLRAELVSTFRDLSWRGSSDTETLLECFERWGIINSLKKMDGMYAIAVWDKFKNDLMLISDRFGEKPIYYGWQGSDECSVFMFSSELKALKLHPKFEGQIDKSSVFALCKYGFIPQPLSIYKNIFKLSPGSVLSVSLDKPNPLITKYWSSIEVASKYIFNKIKDTEKKVIEDLNQLMKECVRKTMTSDVPVGIFLSSGIDSSLIASLMKETSDTTFKAFTIGFDDKNFDESFQATKIAKHLGIEHYIIKITPEMMINAIRELSYIYDEPFADSSQIPTYIVSKFAAEHVKVCLTGDGGDELFCGYSRHNNNLQKYFNLSNYFRKLILFISRFLQNIKSSNLDLIGSVIGIRYQQIGVKIQKFAYSLQANSDLEYYDRLLSYESERLQSSQCIQVKKFLNTNDIQLLKLFGLTEKISLLDTVFYLPNDILTKVDRAAMSVSLETRAPFLNKKIFEFAMRLPVKMKNMKGHSKLILRRLLNKYIPDSLMSGPKKGFSIPLADWLRGPLKDWSENLLSEENIKKSGILDPNEVKYIWRTHLAGRKNFQHILWGILMFQAWHESQ